MRKQKTKLFDDGEDYESSNVLEIRTGGLYSRTDGRKGVLGFGTRYFT
jgi:hypothetical protein